MGSSTAVSLSAMARPEDNEGAVTRKHVDGAVSRAMRESMRPLGLKHCLSAPADVSGVTPGYSLQWPHRRHPEVYGGIPPRFSHDPWRTPPLPEWQQAAVMTAIHQPSHGADAHERGQQDEPDAKRKEHIAFFVGIDWGHPPVAGSADTGRHSPPGRCWLVMDGRSSSSSSSSPFVRTRAYLRLRRPDLVFIFFFLIFFRLIGVGRPTFLVP